MKRLFITVLLGVLMSLDQVMEVFTDLDTVLTAVRIVAVISLVIFLFVQITWYLRDRKEAVIKKQKKNLIKNYRRFKSEISYSKPSFKHYIKKYFTEDEILKLVKFKELKLIELDSKSNYEVGGIEKYEFNRDNK